MSVKASTWAWAQNLPATEKLVLLALADHADDDGVCWPGQEKLAKKTGLVRKSIYSCTKSLEAKGLLEIEARKTKGIQRSNRYRLKLGLMLVPCVSVTHGHEYDVPTVMGKGDPLETSVETSDETSSGASAKGTDVKEFGQGDIEEALQAYVSSKTVDPHLSIKKIQKKGSAYLTSSLWKTYSKAYSYYGYGFFTEPTLKQKGMYTQFQKRLEGIDAAQVIVHVIENWLDFRNETDTKYPPARPKIEFMLKHVEVAGEMYLQSLAKPQLTKAEPIFKKTPPADVDLTKATETGDNTEEDQNIIAYLESLDL